MTAHQLRLPLQSTCFAIAIVLVSTCSAVEPSPTIPTDIDGGAPNATQEEAAMFAWQEFVALNWPAVKQTGDLNTRGVPDTSKSIGDASDWLVWETLRGKVEIYPGAGSATRTPNGYSPNASQDYGFDGPPEYVYDATKVGGGYTGLESGQIPPDVGQAPVTLPSFINLDEDNEIEEDAMFAGAATQTPFPGQQFLYAAKADRKEYTYVVGNNWWYTNDPRNTAKSNTVAFVQKNAATPPPGSSDYVSFLNGTIELKTAWRRLTEAELKSGRFHTNRVRYYVAQQEGQTYAGQPGNSKYPAWREEVWGMCALHIIQKTPSAPYFIFATFEQADTILTTDGKAVEGPAGNVLIPQTQSFDPVITSTPATATVQQILTATPSGPPWPDPQNRLYYKNLPAGVAGHPVPRGPISINGRHHAIPETVIEINDAFQAILPEPFKYYRLVNVQWVPLSKDVPGQPYTGEHPSSYYLSNIVVESDYNLQTFSGKLDNPADTNGLITDFYNAHNNNGQPNLIGKPNSNVPYGGKNYNMGGCMGCHGNIAQLGTDFSFIFEGSSVASPEFKLEYTSLTNPN